MARPNINRKVNAVLEVIAGGSPQDVAARLRVETEEVEGWTASFHAGGRARIQLDFPPRSRAPKHPPPSPDLETVAEALDYAAPHLGKSNYGFFLSNALAMVLANGMRALGFSGVLPDERGGFESRSRSARGLKKLDVNYSTPEMGLGLGLSIKTISSPDRDTKRFTKNYSRNDNELRAEATDYHRRQPYAVLAGFLFMPTAACDDAGRGRDEEAGISSFGAAVRYFRARTPRPEPEDELDRFEAFYVVVYAPDGEAQFWPVHRLDLPPPRSGQPSEQATLDLDGALEECATLYERRNSPPFTFDDGP